MRKPSASLSHKMVALLAAFSLAFSMVPLAWADDAPASTLAGSVAGGVAAEDEAGSTGGPAESPEATEGTDDEAPSAEVQSADAKAADATGSATGTTIKIAVYRSSYPLVWDTGDADAPDATKVAWSKPDAWPKEGSPGSAVGTYEGYTDADEPTRPGFEFLGWSAVKDDPTVAGKLSSLSIPKGTEPVAGDDGVKRITIHALWAPIEYSVVFDLTKNPEDASAIPSFSWTTGKGTFADLGGGRYRLSGVTLEDYDPERGLIEISTPSRGTGGYRFLSWAEPDSQQDPTVAMQPSGTSKWYVNPVALPYYDYEPVLTARWSLSFDVDVPSQITFDEYDSLEQEGNLTDTTDEDAIDEESPDAHDAGKLAHFCSQSTAVDYKIVALRSEMQPTAKDILTTSDSSKATQEQVLESEKLLSLFAASDKSESAGVHFKLTDAIDMDDSSRFGAFVIPKQTAPFDASATNRDDEERLYVSYRLNLDNAVDGATEPNHGLVTPGNVNEGDRTPIAKVSYEFAVADHETTTTVGNGATGSPTDDFFIQDGFRYYGPGDIKAAADDLSKHGSSSIYWSQYNQYLASGMDPDDPADPHGYVRWGDGETYQFRIIGINHDNKADGSGKAGLTFQFVNLLNTPARMSSSLTNNGGWGSSELRSRMLSGDIWSQVPDVLKPLMVSVHKRYRNGGTKPTNTGAIATDRLFLLSYVEIASRNFATTALAPEGSLYEYWANQSIDGGGYTPDGTVRNQALLKWTASGSGPERWWTRSTTTGDDLTFVKVHFDGIAYNAGTANDPTSMFVCPAFCL